MHFVGSYNDVGNSRNAGAIAAPSNSVDNSFSPLTLPFFKFRFNLMYCAGKREPAAVKTVRENMLFSMNACCKEARVGSFKAA